MSIAKSVTHQFDVGFHTESLDVSWRRSDGAKVKEWEREGEGGEGGERCEKRERKRHMRRERDYEKNTKLQICN